MSVGNLFRVLSVATWEQVEIEVDGHLVMAQAPIIVSASRRTDIPAFYADWFINQLKTGYSACRNPFSGAYSYVSYAKTRFVVFWSKNPRPLLSYLRYLKERQIKSYLQYTLNDYDQEGFEPCVPPLAERVETFKLLVDAMGQGSVVWRFDPLLLTDGITIERLLEKVQRVGDALHGYTEKLVFSFADIASYKKVKRNLDRAGVAHREWGADEMEAFAAGVSQLNLAHEWNYELATCSEVVDLSRYGIAHNRCIDGELIARLGGEDEALMEFLERCARPLARNRGGAESNNFTNLPHAEAAASYYKKDKGQRPQCGCMVSKDIGEYDTCPHGCVYCYANSSRQKAEANWARHRRSGGEGLTQ